MTQRGTRDAINLESADFLLSQRGRKAARELAERDLSPEAIAARLAELRADFSPEEAGALLALARLRRRAQSKFPGKFVAAECLFFTAEALEQATAQEVADRRAKRIDRLAPSTPNGLPVLDLGCGIGGDTLALARRRPVIAYEIDPLRLRFAQANVEAAGLQNRVKWRNVDWTDELASGNLPPAAAAFVDPARRADGKRLFSLHTLQPPWERIAPLAQHTPLVAVKVMPGIQDAEIPAGWGIEFVSHEGVCKEAVLWWGGREGRWASVHGPQGWREIQASQEPPPLGPLEPGMALHEPDPAVIRAGAFAELCADLNAHLFDPQIAYLVSREARFSPFAQTFRVEEIHPFSLKLLNRRIEALGIGRIELKKRGMPFEPESLRPRLRSVKDGRDGVVIFVRRSNIRGEERLMLLCHRMGDTTDVKNLSGGSELPGRG